ncbi:hypothetical protein DL96DRAFT_1643395 [Flagelloscypha sp. PMI_526]|nr:hypothetical protein DL96DRAFT_1643395 [Flagelloscypha sp. PMI_526]
MNDRPRRSTRVQSRLRGLDHAHAQDKAPMNSRKRKAAPSTETKARPAKKHKKAKLEIFLELPLDVVSLITEFLDPKTLIFLSRVSRTFRSHLSSEIHWTRCKERAGLPPLEAKDITDRQYVHLLFDTHCHDCGAPNVQKLDLLACSRLCAKCRNAWYLAPSNLFFTRFYSLNSQTQDDLPVYHPQAWTCAKSYQPDLWPLKSRRWSNRPRGVLKISKKLYTLDGEELQEFVQSRALLKAQISRDADSIKIWLANQDTLRKEENAKVTKARIEAIEARLLDLGWTSDILHQLPLSSCENVFIPKPLTERGWTLLKSYLLEELREWLQIWKVRERTRNIVKVYESFFERDDNKPLFPSRKTFYAFDAVSDVLNTPPNASGPPPELQPFEPYDKTMWDAASHKIRACIIDYQSRVTDHAIVLLKRAYEAASLPCPPESSILTEPRSLFRVSTTRQSLITNQVRRFPLIHETMRDRHGVGLGSEFLDGDDNLKVDLEVWKEIREKGSGWVVNE